MLAKNIKNDFQKQAEKIVKKSHSKKVYFTIAIVFTAIVIGLIAGIFVITHNCKKYEQKKDISITTDKTEYEQGEIVKITIENNSGREQQMGFPIYSVEKFENDKWVEIKRVYCPCGAICKIMGPPPIKSRSKLKFEWDQQESWCDDSVAMIYSKKISKQVSAGRYRIKGVKRDIDGTNDDQLIYSNEFIIK